MTPTSPQDSRSPPIILPLAEKSSPFPYPTLSPVLGRNPQDQPPFWASDGVIPLPSDGYNSPFGVDGMHLPGVSNDADCVQNPNLEIASAPPELHQSHRRITMGVPETKFSVGMVSDRYEYRNQQLFEMRTHLAGNAPPIQTSLSFEQGIERQMQWGLPELVSTAPVPLQIPPTSSSTGDSLMGTIEEQRRRSKTSEFLLGAGKTTEHPRTNDPERTPTPSQADSAIDMRAEEPQVTWGEPFKLQWIKTERLPFYRTRHLRNPWNHNREIKVSRDGSELEPSVGQALLGEWDRVVEASSTKKATLQTGQGDG